MNNLHRILATSSLFAIGSAFAAEQSVDPGETLAEVTVTGSRIARDGFQAPTPVTMVRGEDLENMSAGTITDALVEIPAFKGSTRSQTTGSGTTGAAGSAFLNLRGIGTQRTLVQLDGRRVVPANAKGEADVNLLPSALIRSVDIVTGGASAAYGSDAVAGVVNFVLDTRFTGLKADAKYGISDRDDNETYKASLALGESFASNRGHVVFSAEYYDQAGIGDHTGRGWGRSGYAAITNPSGSPSLIVRPNARSSAGTYGGLITAGPLAGTEFGPGGVPQPFVYGSNVSAISMEGGGGVDAGQLVNISAALERYNVFAHARYAFLDTLDGFVEAGYARSASNYASTAPYRTSGNAYTIYNDNAYLPASIRTRMQTAGVTSFRMGRISRDWGMVTGDATHRTKRFVVGFDGGFGESWKYKGYYQHGQNDYTLLTLNDPILVNMYDAADAVVHPVTGQIVCRSTLANPGRRCVPMNLFGEGSPSRESIDFVLGTSRADNEIKQDVVSLEMQGEVFDLWAGPVIVAYGAEYRKETADQVSDPISYQINSTAGVRGTPSALNGSPGGYQLTNPTPLSGEVSVKEGFVETVIPLAEGLPWIERLEFNGAARYTDYSTSGSVRTWKAGVTYTPNSQLRFRTTRSHDIRAANIFELFTKVQQGGGTGGQQTIRDPAFNNTQFSITSRLRGNPDLKPEEGNTFTVGLVYTPSWLQGFGISVDYYEIDLEGAVSTLGAQATIDECFGGLTSLCQFVIRSPATGEVSAVEQANLNLGTLKTSGFDFELSYASPLDRIVDGWAGDLSVRLLATYIEEMTSVFPGAAPIDTAGQHGSDGLPSLVGNLSIDYQVGDFGIGLTEQYISSGTVSNRYGPADIDDNHVPHTTYTDLTVRYRPAALMDGRVRFSLMVSNLFDEDPEYVPTFSNIAARPTNRDIYDMVGRMYQVGVGVEF